MAEQLTFDLGLRPALGREDFLVADSNASAVALVDQWPNWPSHVAAVTGPAGSGKSHLAQVWCNRSRAQTVAASGLEIENLPGLLSAGALHVEDVDLSSISETALFHLMNLARQSSGHILLTAQKWDIAVVKLSDLQTRLSTVAVARIMEPGDDLLRGLLVKLFADRQIGVDEALIGYLVRRMPRSFEAARQLVDRLDHTALQEGTEINRHFASRIMAEMENPQLF